MRQIPTSYGELDTANIREIESQIKRTTKKWDIIWNLGEELILYKEEEKKLAKQILLGQIKDFSIPQDLDLFRSQLNFIENKLRAEQKVLIHCFGGRGRTGMATALVLSFLEEIPRENALKITQNLLGGPETKEQINFVLNFK